MRPIRIGEISYSNVWPVSYFFDPTGLNVELIPQVPSLLNRGMKKGEIDLGPISSFAYGEAYPNYLLLPHLSVSATGAVGSIFLFTKGKSLSELDGAKIALTNTSATSVHLLRILLERFERVRPLYITMAPDLKQMLRRADAAMVIGDDAIRASWSDQGYRAFDLGEEWYLRTGLSMTFAVWAIRKEIVEYRWSEIEKIYDRFIESKEKSRQNLLPVIQHAMNKLGGTEAFWQKYFWGLSHDLGEKEIAGLQTYYRYAAELGFLKEGIKVDPLDKIVSMNT